MVDHREGQKLDEMARDDLNAPGFIISTQTRMSLTPSTAWWDSEVVWRHAAAHSSQTMQQWWWYFKNNERHSIRL